MDVRNLTSAQRQVRMNLRNLFLTATRDELVQALNNYPDQFSKDCIRDLINEHDEERLR